MLVGDKMWLYVILVLTVALFYWWRNYARLPFPNYPPGPLGLPLLGYLPIFTEKNFLAALDRAHDQYGGVISLNLGPSPRRIVIGDYDLLKEAFKDDKASARPLESMYLMAYNRAGDHLSSRGLVFSHGTEWTEQRRFALRRLRDFGLGKSSMEEIIQHEIRQLCNSLDKQLDHPLAMDHIFNISVVNALWTLISGSRFELNDPELLELIKKMDAVIKNVGGMRLLNMLPWLRHIAPQMSGWIDNQNRATALINFIGNVINKHIVDFKSNKEAVKEDPNDFIDAFLVQIDSSVAGSTFHGELGCQNLKAGLLDLLIAGSETTSTVLTWAILFMIKHPDIQTKVRNEILVEVGSSILVHLEDRLRLPYTEAVVQEILRLSCVAPLGVPHYAQADIHLGQYTIPKGSTIYPNLHRIVSNPEVFPEPRTFMPERYLNTKGQYVKNDNNIVFGVGKRDCLGKSLAYTELFMFFAALMQRYNFKSVESNLDLIDLTPVVSSTQAPRLFKVVISKV